VKLDVKKCQAVIDRKSKTKQPELNHSFDFQRAKFANEMSVKARVYKKSLKLSISI